MPSEHSVPDDQTLALIDLAIREDLADRGDITARLIPTDEQPFRASFVAREPGVVAGVVMLPLIHDRYGAWLKRCSDGQASNNLAAGTELILLDGTVVQTGESIATIWGPRQEILPIERTMLNFLGRMSGVATLTRKYVDAARATNPNVQVLDTRKTIPGWRELDKYAVTCGGGTNHRAGLYDAILIKDNHIADVPVGELRAFLRNILKNAPTDPKPTFVEVEVDNLDQFRAIYEMPEIDIILLDNFSDDDTRTAVKLRNQSASAKKLLLEASGGITLETIADVAATGVDRISVGAITHSAVNFDYGLDAVSSDD